MQRIAPHLIYRLWQVEAARFFFPVPRATFMAINRLDGFHRTNSA